LKLSPTSVTILLIDKKYTTSYQLSAIALFPHTTTYLAYYSHQRL